MKRFLILWLILLTLSWQWLPAWAARDFVAASSQFLNVAEAIVTGPPATIAVWGNPNTTTAVYHAVTVGNSANGSMYMSVRYRDGGLVQAATHDGTFSAAQTTATYSAGVWSHVAGTFGSNTKTVYLNGANAVTDNTTYAMSGLNRTRIGSHHTGTPRFDGKLAEVAIWGVELTPAEVAALASGVSPFKVRPASLLSYVPIWGIQSPEIDAGAPRSWALNGTPLLAAHAPVSPFSFAFGR